MLISTFLNADLNQGLMPSGGYFLSEAGPEFTVYSCTFICKYFSVLSYGCCIVLSFYWVLKNDIHLTAESLMHHLSPTLME